MAGIGPGIGWDRLGLNKKGLGNCWDRPWDWLGSAGIEQEGIGLGSQDWLGLDQDRLGLNKKGSQDWLVSNQGLSQDLVLTLQMRITMCHESNNGAHICIIIIHQSMSSRIKIKLLTVRSTTCWAFTNQSTANTDHMFGTSYLSNRAGETLSLFPGICCW